MDEHEKGIPIELVFVDHDPSSISGDLKRTPPYHAGDVAPSTGADAEVYLCDEAQSENDGVEGVAC